MKIGISVFTFLALGLLFVTQNASARGLNGGAFANQHFAFQGRPIFVARPRPLIVERRFLAARPFPAHRRFFVKRSPLVAFPAFVSPPPAFVVPPPVFVAPPVVVVRPFVRKGPR
jgi:hypothetical protein